jgi:hypothetical protein
MTRAVDVMIKKFKHSNVMRQMTGVGEAWTLMHTRITEDYLKTVIDVAILHRDKRHIDTRWVE